ncbi:hypothetical protein AJ79_09356 [Helicocarpus griseus UAMH5409]|uniref:Antigenic cell wall galactomannoprotein n=1 Tax=Helicocarpus griseus UAMH5409 TaxID=1447875 RepID=A0A2B7WK88_9EURO|nr:hypothetical protein AJ79_09356 [Helicocarpus griseus UAMH5409]
MKLTSIFTGIVTVLATSAIASPITKNVKRDASEVAETVKTISTGVEELTATVNGYTGQISTALKIQLGTSKITSSLEDAIEQTQESPSFTQEESSTIALGFIELQPKITTVLDALISKKDVFQKGVFGIIPLTWLVKLNLDKQQELSAQLGEEVVKKLTPDFASLAPLINDKIAADFARAVEAFS